MQDFPIRGIQTDFQWKMPKLGLSASTRKVNAIYPLRKVCLPDSHPKCDLSLGSQPRKTLASYDHESNLRKNTLNHDGTDPNTAITGSDHLIHE